MLPRSDGDFSVGDGAAGDASGYTSAAVRIPDELLEVPGGDIGESISSTSTGVPCSTVEPPFVGGSIAVRGKASYGGEQADCAQQLLLTLLSFTLGVDAGVARPAEALAAVLDGDAESAVQRGISKLPFVSSHFNGGTACPSACQAIDK